jgi:dTDP-4-dehydrorhamnose reductase
LASERTITVGKRCCGAVVDGFGALNILLLGSHGQLGRCLQDQLNTTEHQVAYARRDQLDIADWVTARQKITSIAPDLIVNTAAFTAVDRAEKEHDAATVINHHAVANLAEYCAHTEATLIHVSTDYVFDGLATEPYHEGDTTNPQSIYGASKLAGERAIQASGCAHIILRTAGVYSEYGGNFLKTMLRVGASGQPLNVVADQIVAPTYGQDIARAIVTCIQRLEKDPLPKGTYHYGGDRACSWYDFASAIFIRAGAQGWAIPKQMAAIATADYPTAAKRPAYSVLNSNKFIHAAGISASDWRAGIDASLAALKHQL